MLHIHNNGKSNGNYHQALSELGLTAGGSVVCARVLRHFTLVFLFHYAGADALTCLGSKAFAVGIDSHCISKVALKYKSHLQDKTQNQCKNHNHNSKGKTDLESEIPETKTCKIYTKTTKISKYYFFC